MRRMRDERWVRGIWDGGIDSIVRVMLGLL